MLVLTPALPQSVTPAFPKIRLIAVGKVKKDWIRAGIATYCQRLPELDILEIKDSTPEKEGQQLLALLKPTERAVALTEEGKSLTSGAFADFLAAAPSHSLAFTLGSASGLSPAYKAAAAWCVSLSPLTFPHEIARLLLVEQLYRAKTILQGSRYHK